MNWVLAHFIEIYVAGASIAFGLVLVGFFLAFKDRRDRDAMAAGNGLLLETAQWSEFYKQNSGYGVVSYSVRARPPAPPR